MSYYLPTLSSEAGLTQYLAEIKKFPMLTQQQETDLANAWQKDGDRNAAHTLVTSHLRLVARIAMTFRGYGLPMADIIAEGNIGLMTAVKKFDVSKGFRLATYAMWWIKASINEHILHSWSLVKIGTTSAQKKLFFNLRKLKNKLGAIDQADLSAQDTQHIADKLDVSTDEVYTMNQRMSGGEASLNRVIQGEEGDASQWQDMLVDERPSQEVLVLEQDEVSKQKSQLSHALSHLKPRDADIFRARRMRDPVATLEELAQTYSISRERVRQIEARAYEKVLSIIQHKS